ncbi:MAG TPA: restriction endonuclease [Verrucomicrobia bacterium]|nr:MAG: restriction endonuclease [Lentisphaerae bacterium GWF2_57_35]HBA85736.1 restriction endonuclease [Verrucomicrobiota bacterium]
MNPLHRALIEKAGQEQGWEHSFEGNGDEVQLRSARHKARVQIRQTEISCWELVMPKGLISDELARSFPHGLRRDATFIASSLDELSKLLRRAAELAQSLPNQAELFYAASVKQALIEIGPTTTEVECMVRRRLGQDTFRQALMDYWGGACAVTGIALPAILRASHAKPWADCVTDAERLDVYNGFLLTANLDALFDRGLISFDDTGNMIFSAALSSSLCTDLGLNTLKPLRWLSDRHRSYLRWHREHFFERN